MAWQRVDDTLDDHPKALALSHEAFRLWVCSWTFTARERRQGRLHRAQAIGLARKHGIGDPAAAIAELVEAKCWDEGAEDYAVHDWDAYQAVSEAVRAKRSEAGRKGMEARWGNSADNTPIASVIEVDNTAVTSAPRVRAPGDPNPVTREIQTLTTFASAAPANSSGSARDVVAAYVDACREAGSAADERRIGMFAKEAKRLLEGGRDGVLLTRAAAEVGRRNLTHASALADVLGDLERERNGIDTRRQPASRSAPENEIDARNRRFGERMRAMGQSAPGGPVLRIEGTTA